MVAELFIPTWIIMCVVYYFYKERKGEIDNE